MAARRETVIVIDGSTDLTAGASRPYAARAMPFHRSRGRAAARNAGPAAVGSGIVISLDDDCAEEPRWLRELARPCADDQAMGVGGRIIARTTQTFAERHPEKVGHGGCAPTAHSVSSYGLTRVAVYVRAMYAVPRYDQSTFREAQAVLTANSAARVAQLAAIDGFDEELLSGEDSAASATLRQPSRL